MPSVSSYQNDKEVKQVPHSGKVSAEAEDGSIHVVQITQHVGQHWPVDQVDVVQALNHKQTVSVKRSFPL